MDISLICQRTLDTGYCYEILTNKQIAKCISEDGATLENLDIDVIKDYWVEFIDGDIEIGVAQFKQVFNRCYEAHIHVLHEHRKEYTEKVGIKLWKWVEDNLKKGTVVTKVPTLYPNVREFLLKFKFEETGILKNAWRKNSKQHDMWIFSRGID